MKSCSTYTKELCEVDTDTYLEHVVDYCKKDYQQAYKNQNGVQLTMDEIKHKYKKERKNN